MARGALCTVKSSVIKEKRLESQAEATLLTTSLQPQVRTPRGVQGGLKELGIRGVPRKFFLNRTPKKTPITLIILYQFFRPSIAAQLAGLWCVKLLVLKPADHHVCNCSSSGARLAKEKNP